MTQNVQRESAIPIAIAGVRPRYLKAGNRVELSIVGSGFVKGTQVAFRPANGIEVQTIHTISSAELRVVVFLDGGVAPGQRDVVVQTPDGQCTVLDCGPRALRVLPGLEGSLQGQEAPSWTQTYTDPRDGSFSVIQGQDTNGDGVADRMSTTHYSPNGTKERESWDSVDDRGYSTYRADGLQSELRRWQKTAQGWRATIIFWIYDECGRSVRMHRYTIEPDGSRNGTITLRDPETGDEQAIDD